MRGSRIGWGAVVAACVVAMPAGATHHKAVHTKSAHTRETHHETSRHKTTHHTSEPAHHGKDAHHASHATQADSKPASAAGAISVPAGGTKLYCGPGKSPLMVRKMTQGNGTTVTVVCR